MDTENLIVDPATARGLYRRYKEHVHYSTPIDREIMRAYQLLGQGRLVIKALESITKAGVDAEGFPKLGIVRADSSRCFLRLWADGSARMAIRPNIRDKDSRCYITFPRGAFGHNLKGVWNAEAMVPPVPIMHRPKRGLANYHVLFEADWHHRVPHDPYLLRRVGKSDLWAVLAMWDVSEVERAVLQSRVGR